MTEQFDPSTARSPLALKLLGSGRRNQRNIEQTLNRLVEWAASPALETA